MAPAPAAAGDFPVDVRSVKALQLQQLKRTFDLFAGNYGTKPDIDTGRYVDAQCLLCAKQQGVCILACLYTLAVVLQSRSQIEVQGVCVKGCNLQKSYR